MIKRSGFCLLLATLVFPGRAFAPLPPHSKPLLQQKHQPQRSVSPASKEQAQAYQALGKAAWNQRDLQAALTAYEASLDLWQRFGADIPGHARTLTELGEVLLEVGRPLAALEKFKQAGDLLDKQEDRAIRFEVLIGVGMSYLDLGNKRLARRFYEKAFDFATEDRQKAIAFQRLGTALFLLELPFEAEQALDKSLYLAQKAKDLEIQGYALADRAHVYDLTNREPEALFGFEQARQIFQRIKIHQYVASTLLGTAEVQRELGQFEEAITSIQSSIDLMEQVRSTLKSPGNRIGFFAARHRYYEYRVELLMEQARRKPREGYAVKAFEESESSKARTQLDDMADAPVSRGLTHNEIQSELLDQDSILLSYSLGEDKSYLWVLRPDRTSVHFLPGREELEQTAFETWRALSEGQALTVTRALAKILLPDEIGPLTGKRLLVSADGLLHLIPFALLERKQGRILLDDHVIVHIPSASVLVGMRRKLASRRPAPKAFAGMGDPVFKGDDSRLNGLDVAVELEDRGVQDLVGPLDRLERSGEEIRNVVKLFPRDAVTFTALGFQAKRNTLLDDDLANFRVLHLATHHIYDGHPAFTGIALSRFDERGRSQRGFVTAQEIYDLNLPADLVVLSACGTGLGKNVQGEGPVGLTRAFLHAGAKRVVVSLWNVHDSATAELMKRFYEQMLKGGLSPAEALREAQLSMLNDRERKWRKAYRSWGAFVLQGEPR